ncbi:MAG: L-erythro-3,5-diaminohexanoate dehydrogenase [Actinomycetota bacterium]
MQRFGTHRSVEPRGVLPQQARVLNPHLPLAEDEVLIDVDYLNIDSASWQQLRSANGDDSSAMKGEILRIVSERGKMQNPVTGSGGMLVGTVAQLGAHRVEPAVGKRIATLVSLTLTPMELDEITELDPSSEQVKVKGRAILFGSGIYAEVPDDLDERMVLSILDVCGAPAWAARLVEPGMRVAVIGAGGKSGMLVTAQAVRSVGEEGSVLGLCWPPETVEAAEDAGARAVAVDCTDPVAVMNSVVDAFDGSAADLVVVCANVPGCEGGALLSCDDEGTVLFFSMATSFPSAALVAEGLGKSCRMIIGNGFFPGHADLALDLVRSHPALMKRFER